MFNGLKRGLQLIGQFFLFLVNAARAQNWTAIQDALSSVALVWIAETFAQIPSVETAIKDAGQDAAALVSLAQSAVLSIASVKVSPLKLVTVSSYDPWKGSRTAFEALKKKYVAIPTS